ncbi:septum site-determining protein MinC [Rhodovastum atsumiense]|uniref:septum site-determining protein MinC n=1 Tax=Rhodovastum atsumiense TaxID=504468 RepID=UPI0020253222|nr:septum site-determining protein MinC [Rhodovastum atsumiense]
MSHAFAPTVSVRLQSESQPIELRGETFALATLQVNDPDPEAFVAALEAKIRVAPEFFRGTPVVIEFSPACRPAVTDAATVVAAARSLGLMPVGFRAFEATIDAQATEAGLAKITAAPVLDVTPVSSSVSSRRGSLIVQGPIRSGQSIYAAAGGDLVVLGPVSGAAELIAEGSIHVHGPLRGRVLAGVSGDERARIFASQLSAELVSIAGLYLSADDIPSEFRDVRAQVYLEEGCLRFGSLP